MANPKFKLITNTKIERIKDHKQYDPQLIFSISNPLDPTNRLEREVRLWRSEPNSNDISEQVLESQEKALRELLDDETITFAATKDEAKETDIRFYLEKNGPVDAEGIYQDKDRGYYRIGEPQERSNNVLYRTRFEPKTDGASYDFTGYDPKSEYVLTYQALDDKTKEAFDEIDTEFKSDHATIYKSKRTGNQGVNLTNPIISVLFDMANDFNNRENVKPLTRLEYVKALETKLNKASDESKEESDLKIEEVQEVKRKLEQNPDTVSFKDVMKLVGGTNLSRLHEDLHTAVKKWYDEGSRRVLRFNVLHVPSTRVYRTTPLSTPKDLTAQQYGLDASLEFFTDDLSHKDIIEFLSEADIVDYENTMVDAINETLDGDIENLTKDNNVYQFLNKVFLNRRVTTNSNNGRNDPLKMATYVNGFGDYYDQPYHEMVSDTELDKPTDTEIEEASNVIEPKETESKKEAPLTPDEKADELESKSTEKNNNEADKSKEKDESPWSGMFDADDNPFG